MMDYYTHNSPRNGSFLHRFMPRVIYVYIFTRGNTLDFDLDNITVYNIAQERYTCKSYQGYTYHTDEYEHYLRVWLLLPECTQYLSAHSVQCNIAGAVTLYVNMLQLC